MLQAVEQASAHTEFVDELVGRYALFFHGFIQWRIGNHIIHPCIIIIYALSLDNCLYIEYNVRKEHATVYRR